MQNGASIVDIDGTKALYFDGANDYANIPSFHIRTTDFTIALWIKSDGAFAFSSFVNDAQGSARQFNLYVYYGRIALDAYGADNKPVTAGCSIPG